MLLKVVDNGNQEACRSQRRGDEPMHMQWKDRNRGASQVSV